MRIERVVGFAEVSKELKQERIYAIVREISISSSTKRDCISILAG